MHTKQTETRLVFYFEDKVDPTFACRYIIEPENPTARLLGRVAADSRSPDCPFTVTKIEEVPIAEAEKIFHSRSDKELRLVAVLNDAILMTELFVMAGLANESANDNLFAAAGMTPPPRTVQ